MDEALRDKFVCGMKEEIIQRRLLSEKTLTFKTACDISFGMEMAMRNVKELAFDRTTEGVEASGEVSKIYAKHTSQFKKKSKDVNKREP